MPTPEHPQAPRLIELPRCAYCTHYASERLVLPHGHTLYVCDEHYDQWARAQEDTP